MLGFLLKKRLFNYFFAYKNTLVKIDRITILSFVVSFSLGSVLFGSSIQVKTESGYSLSQVYITHLRSNRWIQTDEFGTATISFFTEKKTRFIFKDLVTNL